jgi:peptide/nickel transport system permease protein
LAKALDVLHHMALPLMTLILIHFGSYLLVMRSSMLETLKDDYIITARAKGLDEKPSGTAMRPPMRPCPW